MPLSANTNSPAPITLDSLPQAIIHVDCDAFFTSVEQALNPSLKGKPVVTGKERGIVACASYEAKALGVKRPMRLFEARKICPELICLPSDYETYSLYSRRLYGILRRFTPDVEEYSIDEAFAELSGLRRIHRTSYEEIALKIKAVIQKELGLTVSMGLSLTKSLAKICSKEKKPAGFTCVKGYELHHYLKKIPAERVCGFGPSSVALLAKHGVYTAWDYVHRPELWAKKLLGKVGVELWRELRGRAVYPLVSGPRPDQVTLSKTKTFTPPSGNRDFVLAQLLRNLESAYIKLRRHRLKAKTISVTLIDSTFGRRGVSAELTRATASTLEVTGIVSELLSAVFDPGLRYRSTSVWLGELEPDGEVQLDLFEDACRIQALKAVSKAVDRANEVYGKHALHLGATDCLRQFNQHLGDRGDVADRKRHLLKGETFRRHLGVPIWNLKV